MAFALQTCSHCASPLSSTAGGLLCPACSLERALRDEPEPDDTGEAAFPRPFGCYELLGEVGRGGMGLVFRARQLSLDRTVALKVLLYGSFGDRVSRQRFRNEAELAARLQHPNIVAIHEVGEEAGVPYLTMDLVDGPDLGRLCAGHPLPVELAAGHLRTIARAVQAAHDAGVLHRDLKPSNILVGSDGRAQVTDFGLAKRQDGAHSGGLTATGQMLGSPSYASPEQAAGRAEAATARGDVYGLGAVLYHLLTGRAPFVAATAAQTLRLVLEAEPLPPRTLNPAIPRDLETICLKCLQKEPARRYATAAALAEEIDRFLDGRPILARPMSHAGRGWRWCRRHPAVAGLTASLFLVLTAAAVAAHLQALRTDRARALAEQAQQAAVTARSKAETLVTWVLDDVEANLETFGRSDQVANLAQQAVAYYENLPAEQRSADTERRHARALTHLGQALTLLAQAPEARAATRHAVAILDRLRAAGDDSEATLLALADALIRDSAVSGAVKDHRAAVTAAERALALVEPRGTQPSATFSLRRCFALVLGNLAVRVENSGDRPRALPFIERELPLLRALGTQPEADTDLAIETARMSANLALTLNWLTADRKRARSLAEEGARVIQQVVDQQPGHLRALDMFAHTHAILAQLSWGELQLSEARRHLELAAATRDRGHLIDPTHARHRYMRFRSRSELRLERASQGEVAAALANWPAELDEWTRLPGSSQWVLSLPSYWHALACWLAQVDDRPGTANALEQLRIAVDRARQHSLPDSNDLRWHQMEIPLATAVTSLLFGDFNTARSEAKKAISIGERCPPPFRTNLRAMERTARSAFAWASLGAADPAAALEITAGPEPTPTNRGDLRGDLAELHTPRALALVRLGQQTQAQALIEPAVAFFRQACAENPGHCGLLEDLARALFVDAVSQPANANGQRLSRLTEAAALVASMTDDYRALRTVQELSGWIDADRAKTSRANP